MFKDFHDKYKCIFIHVPKVAGTSIERSIFETNKWLIGHVKASDYIRIDKNKFESYFSFGFVRNPYDRVVSAYHYLKNGGGNENDEKWASDNLSKYKHFEDFVMDLQNDNIKEKILSWMHFIPQYKFLCDDNKNILVNFVGKLENINDDFNEILDILKIDRKLSHVNKSDHNKYDKYYNENTFKIIRNIYKDDFEIFDYDLLDKNIFDINQDNFNAYLYNKILCKNKNIKQFLLNNFNKNTQIQNQTNLIQEKDITIQSKNTQINQLTFQTKYSTAKARIQSQLSYKLGQTMIINSKSILGIIFMPIYLLSTLISYKQEQKIYQEKIKKDPSLILPPLQNYPDFQEALKEKQCLTYKLGQALIKASNNWYGGGYIKLWFEIRKLKKEFIKKKEF